MNYLVQIAVILSWEITVLLVPVPAACLVQETPPRRAEDLTLSTCSSRTTTNSPPDVPPLLNPTMAIITLSAGSASSFHLFYDISLTNVHREGNRILTNDPAAPIPADQMTVQKCIDGCAAAGFSSAGLEYGHECHCGNISFPPGNVADINDCNMPCLGDASEYVSLFLVLYSSFC
jgi:hypothetical protein